MTHPTSKQLEKLEKAMRLLIVLFLFEVLATLQVCSGQGWDSSCPTCPITPEFKVPEPFDYERLTAKPPNCKGYIASLMNATQGRIILRALAIIPSLYVLKICPFAHLAYAASASDRNRRLEEWEALKRKLGDARRKREAPAKDHGASILVSKLRRWRN